MKKNRLTAELPLSLFDCLEQGSPALLLTTDADQFPHTAFTWSVAVDPGTLRLGVDQGSTTLANLDRASRASLQIIAEENLVFLIKGQARQLKARLESAPLAIAMFELRISTVKDQSWAGVQVEPLAYAWPAAQRTEMQAMEQDIYTEMREWSA